MILRFEFTWRKARYVGLCTKPRLQAPRSYCSSRLSGGELRRSMGLPVLWVLGPETGLDSETVGSGVEKPFCYLEIRIEPHTGYRIACWVGGNSASVMMTHLHSRSM